MNYVLTGHDLKHAAEEMLLQLLPSALLHRQDDDGQTDFCRSVLEEDGNTVTITTQTRLYGVMRTSTRTGNIAGQDEMARKRTFSELVKLGIYDTVAPALDTPPAWGALTGVRPAKLVRSLLERGMTRGQVAEQFRTRYFVSPERTALAVRCAAYAQEAVNSLREEEVSLYIGIPFCPSRCAYCSFVSSSIERSADLIAPYLDALHAEIAATGTLLRELGKKVTSVYIGGGTPTTLSADQLSRLMEQTAKAMDFSALREYTVEAGRPDTITPEKLHAIRAGGADRVSINPQTMNDAVLARIGRKHSAEQVIRAYEQARAAGFPVINMDIIAGLSGDTPESFERTIAQILELAPENITVHTLAIKRGSDLSDRAANAAQHDCVAKMLDCVQQQLPRVGYGPYYLYRQKFSAGGFENVGWCKPETESFYNIAMMEEIQTILSCGAGGVSKRVEPESGRITRFNAPKYPQEYLNAAVRIDTGKRHLLREKEESLC
ncbi:MAG: coproporphyrinogen dehydrogenase HemZ [Butyricicoccus pullicaecorum]|nr:coproporphyrinogen dehydrogenase HemZ [Butyricicoccus pullicaecorum]